MKLKDIYQKLFCPYKLSPHRETYEQIARGYYLTPHRVYQLAHGKRPRTVGEKYAINDLLHAGIIHYN